MSCNREGCHGEDRRVAATCKACGVQVTVSVGHHSGVNASLLKEQYTCLRCRGRRI